MMLTKKSLLNTLFVLWLASELFFQYTLISQIALLLFCVTIVFCVRKIRFNGFIGSLLLFLCWSILNIVTGHTINATTSWDMTITLMINFVFLLLFSQYYWYIGDIRKILTLFSAVVTAFSCICIIVGFGSVISTGRMYIDNINANTAAYYAVYACFWSFYLVIFEKKRIRENILVLLIYVFFITMTGSRGAFFSLLIGLYLLFLLSNKRGIVVRTIIVTMVIALGFISIMNIDILYLFIGNRIEPLLDYIVSGTAEEGSMISRMRYSSLAFSKAKESLFWGYGIDCFRHLSNSYEMYSHNNYAEILFSLGLVGLISYYFPHILNLRYYLTSIFKKNNEAVLIGIFIFVYLASEPFRVTYFNRAFLVLPLVSYLYIRDEKMINSDLK